MTFKKPSNAVSALHEMDEWSKMVKIFLDFVKNLENI